MTILQKRKDFEIGIINKKIYGQKTKREIYDQF